MGLGSLQRSPLLDLSFRMLATGNNGQGKGQEEGEPPAEKYARLCSAPPSSSPGFPSGTPRPVSPGPEEGGETRIDVSVVASDRPPLSEKRLEDVLLKKDLQASPGGDFDASGESREGWNLGRDTGEAGDGCDKCDDEGRLFPGSSFSTAFLSSCCSGPVLSSCCSGAVRRQRTFMPENLKDRTYWEKRQKNNEAARKSREKRRMHDLMLENRIADLEGDNSRLRMELDSLKKRYGIPLNTVFLGQDSAQHVQDDPSPPVVVHQCGLSETAGNKPPGLTSIRDPSPPPLLTLPTAVLRSSLVHQAGMGGMFPTQASSFPFFVSAIASELRAAHTTSSTAPVLARPLVPPAHQQAGAVVVKREAEVDGTVPQTPLPQLDTHQVGSGMPGRKETCPQYVPSSPQVTSVLSSPAVVAAHCGWSDAVPARYSVEHLAPQSWRRSPLSSHSSEDLSDEPLQLTVHRRGSKAESLEEDSGGECVRDRHSHNANGRFSPPHFSLPLKLRRKMPLDSATPPQESPVELSCKGGLSHVNGFVPGGSSTTKRLSLPHGLDHASELTVTQDTPLSLVKKEPVSLVGETAHAGEIEDRRNHADSKHLDPKYLERRRRNNEAARKCRENRRNLTRLWEAKSDHLQSENSQLRQELDSLQAEMKQLRELLDKKGQNHSQNQEASQEQLAQTQERTRGRLQQLEEEHRLLKLEHTRLEKQQHGRRQLKRAINGLQNGSVDGGHRETN